jgi:thioredoxin reductase (NADPH)
MEGKQEFAAKPKDGEPWDVAIIGSGPAALTAAIYTTRGAASTIILGGEKWGGQLMLTTTVDNYPGFPEGIQGPDLMMEMRKQAERFGAEFIQKNVTAVDFNKKPFEIALGDAKYLASSVIIATGADTKWLGVPGEQKLIGRGVSSCAPCDAPFFKDKKIAIVGGGDSAMEEAAVLSRYTDKIMIIHRRDELRASEAMQQKVLSNKNIKVLWDTEVVGMVGEEKLESVKLKTKLSSEQAKQLKLGKINDFQGKIIEEKNELLFWQMPAEGLFVAIGHKPSTDLFKDLIETDEKGYIKRTTHSHTGDDTRPFITGTNIEGVFVAGDVHDYVFRQAVTAAGFGCMAGLDALRHLHKLTPSW